MVKGKFLLKGILLLVCLMIFSASPVFAQGPCTEDADCDDGLFCNGAETCDPLLDCQPGTNPCAPFACNEEDQIYWEIDGTCIIDPPITYQFDFNGDQVWDTEWCLEMGETVDVEVWIDDYNLTEELFGSVWLFVNYDDNYLQLNTENSYIYTTEHGGPWLPGFSFFDDLGGGIAFQLQAASYGGVLPTDGKVKLAVIQLERIGATPPPGDALIGTEDGTVVDFSARVFEVADADATIYYCDDANSCTVDACINGSCQNTPDDTICDDGLFCNGAETCDPLLDCQPGTNPCAPFACNEEDQIYWEIDGTCIIDPPITYQFDFNGDQVWDTEWCLEMGETVDVEVWIDDYNLTEELFGSVWLFVNYDDNYLQLNTENSYIYTTEHGGPWLPGFSFFDDLGGGIAFQLQAASYGGVLPTDGKVKLAVIQLERIGATPPPGDALIGTEDGTVVDFSARVFEVADADATIYYCDDANSCTVDACINGSCQNATIDCSSFDDQCNDGVCDPGTGNCVQNPVPKNGDLCDDGVLCTVNDTCDNGTCSGSPVNCSSLNDQCYMDACNPGTGNCFQDPAPKDGNPCDDGDSITVNDTCSDGVCMGELVAASQIPTLSEWGIIIFITIILGIGVVAILRRRMI